MDLSGISGITKNTKIIKKDYIYFCFIGEKFNGHNFILEAFKMGAKYVIGTEDFDHENYIKVDDINSELVRISKIFYNFNKINMNFVGVTGTDGKTSTSILIDYLLNKLSKSAYLGTSGFIVNEEVINYNGMTTPFADELFENIKIANDKACDNFIMEVSSHALEQKRVEGLTYDIGIFTNFSQDHLDFHKNMDDYLNAKLKLLNYVKKDGFIIVNTDDEKLKSIKDDRIISIGINETAKYRISEINESFEGTKFTLTVNNKKYIISTKLLASFNVYNLVCAVACVNNLGFEIFEILKHFDNYIVEGRMQLIESEKSPNFILDFAHTPDSIEKIMSYVNKIKKKEKIFVITGSAGERDSSKRSKMGYYAAKYSDYLILTEDDPRSESVESICDKIKSGVENKECYVIEIYDRYEAIKYAVNRSSKNDIIILLGKAGQKKMYYDGYESDYIEYDVVKKIMSEV
ncbi:MAG: UDP-N-acetylmuramoyl-L-alanyl-D-glutamate--2,6-diaminopimelate ligase [Mycoplasmatales bacterium]